MSKTVDERVVEMRFDNKQFEANVATSMSTLNKLENSLKLVDASKGLENINKTTKDISFDSIISGVEALQKRFSTFGIVSMRVIENVTDSMINLASRATSFVTDGIIGGGKKRAMNLENAHFQLQGLLKDEQAVSDVMQNVNDSVDGTAYSLDAAAKVASQLAASGMRAGDQMFHSLRAVAGVAAMTNSEYEEIGRIFTKVAGQGRLMGDDLLSLSSRGMNAAATLGTYLGKSEAEVRDMVSKGKLDFQTFADAMDDAFGEHAKKANETFTGALSNIRAALARIGALFISPLVEQNGALVQLFNAIRLRINDIKTAIQPVANVFVKAVTAMANALTAFLTKLDIKSPIEKLLNVFSSNWDKFSSKLESAGISMEDFQSRLTEVASKHGLSVDELINKYGSLGKVISSGAIAKNIIVETLQSFVNTEKSASAAAENITSKLETFNKVTKEIINGNYGNGEARVKALTEAGYEYATMQKLVNYIWERNGKTWKDCNISAEELTNTIGNLSSEELQSIGYTEEEATKIRELAEEAEKSGTPLNKLIENMTKPSGKELIIDSFRNALKGLSSIMATVKSAWNEMVKPISTEIFSKVAEGIHSFSQKLVLSEENAEKLKTTFKGLFAILDLVRSVVSGAVRTAFRVLSAILSSFNLNILDVTAYIGNAVIKFRDWIKENNLLGKAINTIVPIIKSASTAVANWVANNKKIQNGIRKFKTILETTTSSVGKWVEGLKETDNIVEYIVAGFVNGLRNAIPTLKNVMIELGKAILSAIKGVLGINSPSTEFFAIGENVIQGFINGVKSGLSTLFSLFGNIGQKCLDIVSKIDFAKAFAVGIAGGMIYTANNVLKTIETVTNAIMAPAKGIGKMTSGIGNFFNALADNIKPNKWKNMSKTVMELAVAIGILSASVCLLAKIETAKLWGAIAALGALAVILGVLSFAVSKMDISGEGFGKLALVFVGLAASLYVMGTAIKKLDFLDENNIVYVLGALSSMVVGLSVLLLAMGKMIDGQNEKSVTKAGITLLKIATTMLIMTATIKVISGLEPAEIAKGIICMTLFGGLITGLMAATKLAGKDVNKLGSVIFGIATAMLLMVGIIKIASGLEPAEIAKGIICMTLFGGLITGLMAATKLIGKNVGKIGSSILAISSAMMLMVLTIKMVANMEPSEIAKGVICIALFGGIVTGLIAATNLAGGGKLKGVASTLLAMSLAIGVLAGVAIVLSIIDLSSLAKGITAVGMLSAMMALMVHATKGAENCKGSIIAMTVAIGLMATAVAALSFIDPENLIAATLSLSVVMGMFALVETMAGKAKVSVGAILSISVAIGLLSGVLYLLSGIPAESLIPTAVALSTLLLAMSRAMVILSNVQHVSISAIGSIALMGLVVAELGVILGLMTHFNVQPSMETALALSTLLLAMSGALAILTVVGLGGPAAFIGIGALVTLIAGIGGLMVGIGALCTYIPDMQTWLTKGISVLEQIGYGLGSFFGNIIGGFLGGATSGFSEIGNNLSAFITSMRPFFDGVSGLDENTTNAVKTLAETILILTGAGMLEGISSWLTGGSSLSTFGEQLIPFGQAIKDYGDTVSGIDVSGIQQSVDAGKALAELASALPNSGGVAGFFAGENDMDDFADKLVPFGKAIKEYGDTVSGIDTSGIQQSVDAGQALSDLANVLPNSGGAAGFFAGENDIDQFGEKLVPFGKAIKDYGDTVSGIDVSGIQQSVTAGQALSDLADSLPNSGGVAGFFAGNNDIDTFGKKLVKFGEKFSKFYNTISGINISGVASQLSGFKNALDELGNTGVDKFIDSFNNGSSKLTSAINTTIDHSIDAIKKKNNKFKKAGKFLVDGFAKGITDNTFKAEAKAKAMAKKAYEAAKKELDEHSPSKKFAKIGAFVVEGFAKGITNSLSMANDAAVKMANGVLTATQDELGILSPSVVFKEEVGKYIVQGIAEGITSDMSAEEAAKKKAQNIVNAFQDEIDKIDLDISNREKDFELWQLTDGETVSDIAIYERQRKELNNDLWDYNQLVRLTTAEYTTLKEAFGDNNESVREAYGRMKDAEIKAAEKNIELNEIDALIISSQEEHLDNWKTINENGLEIMDLEATNGYIVSDADKDSRYLSVYKDNINIAKKKETNAQKAYDDALAKYGDINHSEVQAKKQDLQDAIKERIDAEIEFSDYKDSIVEKALQKIEDNSSHKDDIIERWESQYGDDASPTKRYLFYKNVYKSDIDDAKNALRIINDKYDNLVKDIAEKNGITYEEAKQTEKAVDYYNNKVYPAETELIKARKKMSDLDAEKLNQQKENLKDQYETASDIADIKYQIWELTTGRDATDAEKDTMKLVFLTQQLNAQAKLVEMAKDAWKNASADEKLEKEQEYWNAQLQLAQLQSEVLDIQEANTKRQKSALDKQRLAQDEYEDYMKRYEKYYLDHGMTLDDLERDAKLVSGYDPNKVTTTAVNKTNSAIDTIKTNVTNLTKAVSDGIQNGVTEITTTTTSMLDSCADVLSEEKDNWFNAGADMAEKLAEGIRTKIETIVDSVTELVYRSFEAMNTALENGNGYSSGISVVGGTVKLASDSTLSFARSLESTSYNLAKSIARYDSSNDSDTPAATQSQAPVYSFTQNNYSPKSLSAVEIYRQTNNMMSRLGKRVTQ